jgi:hypothetical protein
VINRLFVVERYDESGRSAAVQPFPVLPIGMRLACAVHLPADDVVLALIEGQDEASICAAVTAAGWRVDRITAATWAGATPREVAP